ncbi:MAG: DUF1667 domain-containing protein [Clostridia bacterium]|nr:DUF1667 domain-containing protein [Clostridia bacterium]
MKRNLTCIVCPMGCQMVAVIEDGKVVAVTGNTCARGKQYAIDECTNPRRTVTSTVRTQSGGVVAVKTNRTIPKSMVFDAMREINRVCVALPVCIGDVVIENLLGTGADVVITANME